MPGVPGKRTIKSMPRDGSPTLRNLTGKPEALRVECPKYARSDRYRETTVAETIDWDGALTVGYTI
jgi:hypothetical protein